MSRLLVLALLVTACQRESVQPSDVRLVAVPHSADELEAPQGRARVEALVTRWPKRPTEEARQVMRRSLEGHAVTDAGHWPLRSVYVFRRSETLTELDPRSPLELKRDALLEVVAFARWSDGVLDLSLLVDEGDAVFDLLEDRPIDPPFELR